MINRLLRLSVSPRSRQGALADPTPQSAHRRQVEAALARRPTREVAAVAST